MSTRNHSKRTNEWNRFCDSHPIGIRLCLIILGSLITGGFLAWAAVKLVLHFI